MTHALVTGPITGRIPHGDGFLDVTPDVVYLDSAEEAQKAAESIELEHAARGTHPIQEECAVLSDRDAVHPGGLSFSKEVISEHQAAHKALNKKAGL